MVAIDICTRPFGTLDEWTVRPLITSLDRFIFYINFLFYIFAQSSQFLTQLSQLSLMSINLKKDNCSQDEHLSIN